MVTTAKTGIIDTFTAGFTVIHRRPWLVAFPVLLDLAFWRGPRVTAGPVAERALTWYEGFMQSSELAGAAVEGSEQMLSQARDVATAVGQGNLVHLLAWQLPSLARTMGSALGDALTPAQWELSSTAVALMVVAALLVAGLFGTAIFLGTIARGVRESSEPGRASLQAIVFGWMRLAALYGLLTAAAMPVGIVLLFIMGIAGVLSPVLLSLSAPAALAVVMLVALYLAFADEAIFVSDAGPWEAMRRSVYVVGRSFWPALAFLLLSNVITAGLTIVWVRLFGAHPAAAVVAIVGHAYIATGLTAAAMLFYRHRAAAGTGAQNVRNVPVSPV